MINIYSKYFNSNDPIKYAISRGADSHTVAGGGVARAVPGGSPPRGGDVAHGEDGAGGGEEPPQPLHRGPQQEGTGRFFFFSNLSKFSTADN